MLIELQASSVLHTDKAPAISRLMTVMDKLNQRYGRLTVQLATAGPQGKDRAWSMKQNLLTPQYTVRCDDIKVDRA